MGMKTQRWARALLTAVAAFAAAESGDPYTQFEWQQLPDMPVSISGTNVAWIDGKLVVANGRPGSLERRSIGERWPINSWSTTRRPTVGPMFPCRLQG